MPPPSLLFLQHTTIRHATYARPCQRLQNQSRCRCGRGEPRFALHCSRVFPRTAAHTAGRRARCDPTSAPRLGSPLPHLRRDWAHPCHICAGTGLTPATSAPGLGSPLSHPHREWAHPSHIRTGTAGYPRVLQAGGLGAVPLVLSEYGCSNFHWPGPAGKDIPGQRDFTQVCALLLLIARAPRVPEYARHLLGHFLLCSWTTEHATLHGTGKGGPSPGQMWEGRAQSWSDVGRAGPVLVQMWEGRAQSWCRCGKGGPSPDADVGGEPSPWAP